VPLLFSLSPFLFGGEIMTVLLPTLVMVDRLLGLDRWKEAALVGVLSLSEGATEKTSALEVFA